MTLLLQLDLFSALSNMVRPDYATNRKVKLQGSQRPKGPLLSPGQGKLENKVQ